MRAWIIPEYIPLLYFSPPPPTTILIGNPYLVSIYLCQWSKYTALHTYDLQAILLPIFQHQLDRLQQGRMSRARHHRGPPPPFADGAYDKILYQAIYDYLYNLTARLLVKDRASLFLYVNIYVDYFIMIVQGGPDFHQRVCNNLFHCIYKFFRLNDPVYQYLQEPNHIKNILQGNGIWMEWKRILRCLLDTLSLTVPLPCKWLAKV